MQYCIICNSPDSILQFRSSIALLYCPNCTVHVLEQIPSQEHLDSYYASNYTMSANEILASEHRRLFRIPEQFWLISQLQKYGLERSSSVLDIGCDKGYFLDQCRRFGYSVQGVEPSDSARAYCATIGLDIRQHISELDSTVDAITMWHVLEHFTDPKTLIKQCHALLNENGILFIRVPNFSSFWSKILGKYWIWFQPQNHYVHYSQKALQYLVESNGFDILTCESRKPNNAETFKAGLLADKTLKKSFSYIQPLKKLLGRIYEHLTGTEIYLVAKKR